MERDAIGDIGGALTIQLHTLRDLYKRYKRSTQIVRDTRAMNLSPDYQQKFPKNIYQIFTISLLINNSNLFERKSWIIEKDNLRILSTRPIFRASICLLEMLAMNYNRKEVSLKSVNN